MNRNQFSPLSFAPLNVAFLLLLILTVSLASRPLAAKPETAAHQLFLPVIGVPQELDDPTVGYATGTDRTLIRWFCSSICDTDYEVYRRTNGGAYQLLAAVGRETNSAAAILTLNNTDPRWPDLYDDLRDIYAEENVNNVASLYGLLDQNKLIAQKLTNEYYPVALINGWGYLDTAFVAGTTYEYRVVRTADDHTLGEVKLIAGQITPLPAPQNVQALALDPEAEDSELTHAKADDWGRVQADRRFHHTAYLKWDVGNPSATSFPAAWTIGYDIYRTPRNAPNAFSQVNGEISVQPLPASAPTVVNSQVVLESPTQEDYQLIDHFYADQTAEHGDYLYRVAPRDALAQVRQWPAHTSQFSAAVPVTTYDFLPPLPPQNAQATVNANHTLVTVSWEMPDPPADLGGFRIERTLSFHNDIPTAECGDEALCWMEVATVGKNTFQWVDNDPELEQARWYRLQAVDDSDNRSMYTMPVHATLHDIDPPGPPLLTAFPCGDTPSDPNPPYCLSATGDSDVTRYLVGCTFSADGNEIFLVEQQAAANGSMPALKLNDLYQPPFRLTDVSCRVRAVDEMGNMSEPSNSAVVDQWTSEQPPDLPNPMITSITTIALDESGDATAQVRWDMPRSPLIDSFSLERVQIASTGNITENITSINGNARSYLDNDVRAGHLYQYRVTAELKFGLGDLTSEPRFYRALSDGRRPLVLFNLTTLTWDENMGTTVSWNSCDPEAPIDGQFNYAVFRSIALNEGYTQVTPIFSISTCMPTYVDANAQHGRYFYAIMEFDGHTGEPIGYTVPSQFDDSGEIQTGSYIPVVGNNGLVQSTLYTPPVPLFVPNCTAINPAGNDFTQPLLLGDGFELHNLVINSMIGNNIGGFGDLRVVNNGVPIFVPTAFNDLTVADAQNRVCTGLVVTNIVANTGAPIEVTPAVGLTYQVAEITARPFFANISDGTGKVKIIMPNSLRVVDENGEQLDSLNLAGPEMHINANLGFSFQTNLDNIANHGCAAGEDPILGFSLETMPTIVVPTGVLTASPAGIQMAGSCMDYDERYNPVYAAGNPRPAADNLNAGDSNDGFLRGRYTGSPNSTQISPTGLAGAFTSNVPLSYVASYPYGFSLELNGNKSLVLAESHISVGALGAGTAAFNYNQSLTDETFDKVTVLFNNITVDAQGGLYATVTPDTAAVTWMHPNGFVAGLLHSELYLGQVTSDQRPGQVLGGIASSSLWATRPADSIDLGLENPATLEPGLNIRRADHGIIWKTCPTGLIPLPAVVDSYIRHSGVSERFQAQIETPFVADIHGYETLIDNFDLSFLDNYLYDSHITGDVDLPFPADLNLRFISMWFELDGCIGGGELLNGFENIAYWGVNVNFNYAEFSKEEGIPNLPGYPNWDRVLRTRGALELPHVSLPNQPAPTLIGVEVGFRPDGQPYGEVLLDENRPDFEFDGFPLLLTGLRLSTQGEAANWDDNATAAGAPNITDWNQVGFVEMQGAISAPYFGLLVRETGGPGDYPHIQMQVHNDYVGFDEQLKGARVWVDLPVVQVTHQFENLVYASSALENHGLLIGFREYEFVPQAGIDALGLPQSAKFIHMDAAVMMEPEHVHFFLGQSAGTAAFRAMAEAVNGASPDLPGDLVMALWAGQLNMSNVAMNGYRDLAAEVWDTYATFANPDFRITTQVLNEYDRQPGQSLPQSDDFGGGTLGIIRNQGVHLNKIRGHVEVDGIGLGMQLEAFQMALELIVQLDDEEYPILHADTVSFMISRYGDYIFEGVDVGTSLVRNDLTLDLTGLYNPNTQAIEAGVGLHKDINLVHDLEMWSISLNELTGAVGLGGGNLRYIGLNIEASWNFVPFKAGAFGGQILAGTIDPSSPVLNNHFPDVLAHLHIVPAAPGENSAPTLLKGAYIRLYGDTTQGDTGVAKVYTINGGVRYGGWYWSDEADGEYFGAILGTFIHMNYLKVFSARGDLTFTYEATPEVAQITAAAWLAAGIGSCEPETWTSWETRWWNDKWCWTGGVTQAWTYDYVAQDFDVVMQFDVE
jgi:hypothetical protein